MMLWLGEISPGNQANVFIITNITGDYNKIQLDHKPLSALVMMARPGPAPKPGGFIQWRIELREKSWKRSEK